MHVVAGDVAMEEYFRPRTKITLAISGAGGRALADFLERALTLDAAGRAIIIAPGHLPGRSVFVRTHGDFHLFNVCNHWMARALRAAGIDVNARLAWSADGVVADARRAAPAACPP
jgi:hypothetical protein